MLEPVEEMLSPRHMLVAGYITLSDIKLEGLPGTINYEGNNLVRKDEFHITIISTTRVAERISADNPDKVQKEIIEEFRKISDKDTMRQFKLLDKFRFVTRDVRKTVIVECEFPGGDEFFEALEHRFGKSIPRQPFHITIFSLEPKTGISLSSPEEMEATKKVVLPELKQIRPA